MKNTIQRAKNMTDFGEIYDEDGYKDCLTNLAEVLNQTISLPNAKSRIFKVLVSKVGDDSESGDFPFRYSKERKLTLRQLKNLWEKCRDEKFSEASYQKYLKEKGLEHAFLEKEGEARAAWGLLAHIGHQMKVAKDEENFQEKIRQLSTDEQEKAIRTRKEKSHGGPVVYIG